MESILCGHQLDRKLFPQLPIISFLLETCHSLVQLTSVNSIAEETFTDLALLLRSQRSDENGLHEFYQNDIDIYIGALMKSHFTYTATTFMSGARMVEDHQRLWTMSFLGQLTDDCRDFEEDRREQSITPVTYYAEHGDPILNPIHIDIIYNIEIERILPLARAIEYLHTSSLMLDDLLDVEGNTNELGKLANIDQQNQTMTYVSWLDIEKTRKRIHQMRKQAGTILDVIRHIFERKKTDLSD